MVFIILIIVFTLSIYIGKYYFNYWFNPISIYSFVWFILIFLYELKLLRYYDLRLETWLVIVMSYTSFLCGSLIIFFSRASINFIKPNHDNEHFTELIWIAENKLYVKFLIISTGIIGLIGGIQHWMVLLKQFGSIQNVLIYANIIYAMRVQGEIEGVIPYLSAFGFVSLFFAAVYSAYRREISWLVFLPVTAIIIKDIANIGRAFILFALIEFITVYILFRFFNPVGFSKRRFNKKKLIFMFLLFIALMVASASFVRSTRGTTEHFKGSSTVLRKLNILEVISPSIYLYFSSDVGVLNKFLQSNVEKARFGENTFKPIYNFLSKFEFVEKPSKYQKGYFIPMWVNTGSYLRELFADFGVLGITIGPFLLGLLTSFFWIRVLEKGSLINFVVLCYFFLMIFFTFLVMVSRLGNWFISLTIIITIIYVNDKIFKPRIS